MKKLTLGAVALAASTMIGSAASYADLMGEVWLNQPTVALSPTNAAVAALVTAGTQPNFKFISTAFDYTAQSWALLQSARSSITTHPQALGLLT